MHAEHMAAAAGLTKVQLAQTHSSCCTGGWAPPPPPPPPPRGLPQISHDAAPGGFAKVQAAQLVEAIAMG